MNNQGFIRALDTLRPYLDEIVICGAWAWYVYRNYLGRPLEGTAAFTRDLDCATTGTLPVKGTALLKILEDAGFDWVPRGDETPPAAVFAWPDRNAPEVEIEFLAPARGDGRRRVVNIQPHLTAQALRDLDILLEDPIHIEVKERSNDNGGSAFEGRIRVPNLASFSIQKALIFQRRDETDRVKDLAYVFDLIDSVNGLADRLLREVLNASESGRANEVQLFMNLISREFGSPAFVNRILQQMPQERRPLLKYVEREIAEWLSRLRAETR